MIALSLTRMMYAYTVLAMKSLHADNEEAAHYGEVAGSSMERLLLYVMLAAGYAFLGFFGWLLTL